MCDKTGAVKLFRPFNYEGTGGVYFYTGLLSFVLDGLRKRNRDEV